MFLLQRRNAKFKASDVQEYLVMSLWHEFGTLPIIRMARSITSHTLGNRTNRLKLLRGKSVFVSVQRGLALGYRRARSTGAGSWQARAWDGNEYRYENLGVADDYSDADGQKVLTFLEAHDRARNFFANPSRSRGKLTVRDAAEHYLEWFRVARKSIAETENAIRAHVLPAFGETKVCDLSADTIRKWHHKLSTKPARKRSKRGAGLAYRDEPHTDDAKRSRKATANRVLTVLKAILNKAFDDDLAASRDAWTKVKPFANADEPSTRFLTQAEAIRLSNACPPDLRELVKGALLTGARYAELVNLKVADVNLGSRRVFIAPSKGKSRHVPLNDEGVELFQTLIAGKVGDEHVFTKSSGHMWGKNHQVRPLQTACQRARIAPIVSFHELRHTYASLLAQAGVDLLPISKLLGHADTRITARHYAHLCDKTLANAVDSRLPSFNQKSGKRGRSAVKLLAAVR